MLTAHAYISPSTGTDAVINTPQHRVQMGRSYLCTTSLAHHAHDALKGQGPVHIHTDVVFQQVHVVLPITTVVVDKKVLIRRNATLPLYITRPNRRSRISMCVRARDVATNGGARVGCVRGWSNSVELYAGVSREGEGGGGMFSRDGYSQ